MEENPRLNESPGDGRREPFHFYALEPSRYEPRDAALAPEYEISCWTPSLTRFWPPGAESLIGRRTLLLWWVYDLLSSRHKGYRIYLIYRSGRLVHYSVVSGRNPRFPFMGPRDLQYGPAWTAEGDRRRGLQRAALDATFAGFCDGVCTVWWLCRASNVASNIGAQSAGFELRGCGWRRPRFGLWIAGAFRISPGETR
jgi:hypothetical protein